MDRQVRQDEWYDVAMKRFTLPLLFLFMALPLLTLFAFDSRYNAVESRICEKYEEFRDICTYPERHERDRLVRTNFYRHLGSIVSRSEGTSPSADSYIAWADSGGIDNDNGTSKSQDDIWRDVEEAQAMLGMFDAAFFAAMFASFAVSGAAAVVFVQQLHHKYRHKAH